MDEPARVTIFRFDPDIDKTPRYQTYLVPPEGWKELTVLDTIRYIYERLDRGLAFRDSCRVYRICAACTIRLNKKVILACDVMSTKEMLLEPAPNYPLVKDLVVSFAKTSARENQA